MADKEREEAIDLLVLLLVGTLRIHDYGYSHDYSTGVIPTVDSTALKGEDYHEWEEARGDRSTDGIRDKP